MEIHRLQDMFKGWFVGDFEPTLHKTQAVEVAVKYYRAGDNEAAHYHAVATEFTVVVSGEIRMGGRNFTNGDVIVIPPGEATDFEALTDAVTTVVKIPGAKDDKYVVKHSAA